MLALHSINLFTQFSACERTSLKSASVRSIHLLSTTMTPYIAEAQTTTVKVVMTSARKKTS